MLESVVIREWLSEWLSVSEKVLVRPVRIACSVTQLAYTSLLSCPFLVPPIMECGGMLFDSHHQSFLPLVTIVFKATEKIYRVVMDVFIVHDTSGCRGRFLRSWHVGLSRVGIFPPFITHRVVVAFFPPFITRRVVVAVSLIHDTSGCRGRFSLSWHVRLSWPFPLSWHVELSCPFPPLAQRPSRTTARVKKLSKETPETSTSANLKRYTNIWKFDDVDLRFCYTKLWWDVLKYKRKYETEIKWNEKLKKNTAWRKLGN